MHTLLASVNLTIILGFYSGGRSTFALPLEVVVSPGPSGQISTNISLGCCPPLKFCVRPVLSHPMQCVLNETMSVSTIILIHILCLCVCLCMCMCVPMRSCKRNVSPYTLHQHKELPLVSCTNCLTSSLLEHEVVNLPFAFLCSFNL